MENLIKTALDLIPDEDSNREGLLETPSRVKKMWQFFTKGYKENPADLFKTFEAGTYDELILLRNITFFSTCEHHSAIFSGLAHVAYFPNGKVLGASKLIRLLEIYTRRLQIQERITEQVANDLMKYLDCRGAACIMIGKHTCIQARGVQNQTAELVTSSLKGTFLNNFNARQELLQLIKG